MYKGKGRPSNKIKCIRKTIYLRIDLQKALETFPNQTKVIQEALENYIFFKDKSDEMIQNEIETHQKIIQGLQSRLISNQKLRTDNRAKEEKNKKYWNNFQEHLKGNKPFNTKEINCECNTDLESGSVTKFRALQERYKNGTFGFEDFLNDPYVGFSNS